MRKTINLCLVLLMLGAQFALAQHATVHFLEHGHISHEKHQNDGAPQTGDLCQICVFAKSMSDTVTPNGIFVEAPLTENAYLVPLAQSHITRQASHGYLARGPPSSLI